MKSDNVVRNALAHFGKNELIFASKLYRETLYGEISEAAYYKTLERMCKSGELAKIAKGTYYLPKVGKYGVVPPSEKEIVAAFTADRTGTVIGYKLYNSLNLTTQISKNVDVMSSALDGFTKSIRNVIVHQVKMDYSKEIEKMVQGMDVLQNFYSIQDINYKAFMDFSEEFAERFDEEIFEEVYLKIGYKKSTVSFLREILDFYEKDHNLSRYLSELSEYKHPRMEEIYEITRISK